MARFNDNRPERIVKHGQIDLDDLRELLREQLDVPRTATVQFWVEIPSGGDYSGQPLDIEDEGPQAISFKAEWTE